MAENRKPPSDTIEVKLQMPRQWKPYLELLSKRGMIHTSQNNVALSLIAKGIMESFGAKDELALRERYRLIKREIQRDSAQVDSDDYEDGDTHDAES